MMKNFIFTMTIFLACGNHSLVCLKLLFNLHNQFLCLNKINYYIQSDIPRTDCSRATVDESIWHDNDVMEQFVFLLLSHAIFFHETLTELDLSSCQCYCKEEIDINFPGFIFLSTTGMRSKCS